MLTLACIDITKAMSSKEEMIKINKFKININTAEFSFKEIVAKVTSVLLWEVTDIKKGDNIIEVYVEIPITSVADTIERLVEDLEIIREELKEKLESVGIYKYDLVVQEE